MSTATTRWPRPAEDGLRSLFSITGIEIADSSAKAVSCDWVYSMEGDAARFRRAYEVRIRERT